MIIVPRLSMSCLSTSCLIALTTAACLVAPIAAHATAGTCEGLFLSLPTAYSLEPLSQREMKLVAKRRQEAGAYFRANLRLPEDDATAQLKLVVEGDLSVVSPITIRDIVQNEPKAAEVARNRVLNTYVTLAKTLGRTAGETELAQALDLKVEALRDLFGEGRLFPNLVEVKNSAVAKKPKAFDRVIDTTIFTPERNEQLLKAVRERQRLIVTTAVANSPVNKDFFATLLRAAREMDAEILIFPANMQTNGLDPILLNTPGVHIITNTVDLGPSLALNNMKITAKQINPLMGLNRIGKRGQSQIFGSPKLHLRTVPTIDNEINPHFLMTTGAVTEPIYNGKLYIQERTNAIAAEDHVLGALILEKSLGSTTADLPGNPSLSGFFHFRHVEYVAKEKGFTDINKFYTADGVKASKISAIALSDLHIGVTDPTYMRTIRDIIQKFRPERIAFHDLFNGHSVSHHDRMKLINNAMKYKDGTLDLEAELKSVTIFLNTVLSLDPKLEIRVVLSNHDLWLNRWLNDGQFMHEPHNRALGIELASVMVRGESPLEYAMKKYGLEYPKRVVLLQSGSWKESGVEMGQHGHVGANGAKGSLNSMALATDRSIFGHTHTNQRTKHTVNIGTATELRQDYNRDGASSWSQSFATVSIYGEIQLFILRHGEWWVQKGQNIQKLGPDFFVREYPAVRPNNDPSVGQQVDQYSNH